MSAGAQYSAAKSWRFGDALVPLDETLVQAVTEHGAGFWVLTPLRTGQGIIFVNRGFVPTDRRDAALPSDSFAELCRKKATARRVSSM